MIERATTHAYPTRYAAFDQPGRLVVLRPDGAGMIYPAGFRPQDGESWLRGGSREMAVFSEGQRNRDWPGCSDGVYVEVRSQTARVGGFVVDGFASAPTLSRRQRVEVRRSVPTLEEALRAAEELAKAGRAWVAHHLEHERVLEVGDTRLALLDEDGRTLVLRAVSARRVAVLAGGELEVTDHLGLGSTGLEREQVLEELRRVLAGGGR